MTKFCKLRGFFDIQPDSGYPMENSSSLFTIKQASEFASNYLKKNVTTSNISYLIQYGKIKKIGNNTSVLIEKQDLIKYYKSYLGKRKITWKDKLGDNLNWELSFDYLKEADTTKHVHRLHPYKGKFIPQLVGYFLDSHTDNLKKEVYFSKGDIILDPFCGSGTTLVQANELGMHAIGIDISAFNVLISKVKLGKYDFKNLHLEIKRITNALSQFITDSNTIKFEAKLMETLTNFNNKFFPSPEFRYKVNNNEINEDIYGEKKSKEFLPIFLKLVKEYNIKLRQDKSDTFLDKWHLQHVRTEIDFVCNLINKIKNPETRKAIILILSRTIRSCRATTHADLATLKEPITTTYYCSKHGKICKPLFSIFNWWQRYSQDTISRLYQFNRLRTETFQISLIGDSKTINIFEELKKESESFYKLLKNQKIQGIFTSPPYVGLINYHEQHAYAYDLFGFERNDELEIGPLFKGYGNEAKESYIQGISEVLNNCKQFMIKDYNIFLVANDKYDLYPTIAKNAGLKIIKQFKRPVLNRTERDKGAYSEIIFHLKGK